MTCKDIIVLVTLLAFAAAEDLDQRYPPHYHGHGYHHYKPLPIVLNPDAPALVQPLPLPEQTEEQSLQEDAVEEPASDAALEQILQEVEENDEEATDLEQDVTVEQPEQQENVQDVSDIEQDGPVDQTSSDQEENQDETEIDETETEDETNVAKIGIRAFLERKDIPIKCDALSLPMYSCYNCYSYLKCKPEGGKIKACQDPYAPYCNNGICSSVPSDACANL